MKGIHRHSPRTGAELSRKYRYPGTVPLRESEAGDGELTNGELVARDPTALLTYFKRCHRKHHDDPDPSLYQTAWSGIQGLRKADPWDCWLWYALAEYLHRQDYDTGWMLAHAEARCPRCSSRLRYEDSVFGFPNMICASSCSGGDSDRTIEVRDRIEAVYEAAFGEIDGFEAF